MPLFQMQTVHDGRQFMKYIDPKLGVPLPERDYGGNCLMYDPGNTTDPFHNIWVRIFVLFHATYAPVMKEVVLFIYIVLPYALRCY